MTCRFCNAECGAESVHYCALGERTLPRALERITVLEQRVAELSRPHVYGPISGPATPITYGPMNPETA